MKRKIVTLTGGSGFVGQILRRGLAAHGCQIRLFDQFRGPAIDLLRRRFLAASTSRVPLALSRRLKRGQLRAEELLIKKGIVRPSPDDILDSRSRLSDRFRGSDAIIHLAGLPHEHVEGATAADFQKINYEGSINVFEAARAAGVPKFVFASSAQVYKINNPVRLDQFPILESNYCPTPEEGQSLYGWLKIEFENYLARTCAGGPTQAISLRLEMPGVRSPFAHNFYISTSIENLISGFVCALSSQLDSPFDVFNLADAVVDKEIVDIQSFIRQKWPKVINRTAGNECLLGTEKATRLLNYRPQSGGHYYDASVIWD